MSAVVTATPAYVPAHVSHRRTRPFSYEFKHRTSMWLVDTDDVDAVFPRWLRALVSIRSEDHFAAELRAFLAESVVKWQLPDAWTFIEAVPRTSVGKFDKKVIRKWYADGQLDVSSARG